MILSASWDFSLANYDAVWAFLVQFGLLLLFLMIGNILRRKVSVLRTAQVPSALLGGLLLLLVNLIAKRFGGVLVDNQLMQVITYHCLAIGFAAMSLKSQKSNHKTNPVQVMEFGALLTYLYIRKVAKECFKGVEHEFFLLSFGAMTGTASNGMIMMKEIDPGLRTPASSLYILSNFPAMVMIAPLLFMLGFASKSLNNALIALAVFFGLWLIYTIYQFNKA